MMKRQSVCNLLDDMLYISVMRGTESIPAPTDTIFVVSAKDNICIIGQKILESLEAFIPSKSRFNREDWKNINKPLLSITNIKTEKALFNRVKIVHIVLVDGKISFYPTINKGWKSKENKTVGEYVITLDLKVAINCDVGAALLEAITISTLEV